MANTEKKTPIGRVYRASAPVSEMERNAGDIFISSLNTNAAYLRYRQVFAHVEADTKVNVDNSTGFLINENVIEMTVPKANLGS